MTPMDHAEAHERIADLAIEPGRLAQLRSPSPSAQDERLLAHVAGCQTCQAELEAWAEVHGLLAASLAGAGDRRGEASSVSAESIRTEPIRLPEELRRRVLGIPRAEERSARLASVPTRPGAAASIGRRGRFARALLATAAAIVVLVGAGVIRDQATRLETARAEQQELSELTAALDRLLSSPKHAIAALERPDGSAGGSVSWSGQDIVVLTTALQPPSAGQTYRCWLREGETRTSIGRMHFVGGVAYWSGSLDEWATVSITSGSELGVSLEPDATGSTAPTGPPVLLAQLGS
jgi:hypothetical protein